MFDMTGAFFAIFLLGQTGTIAAIYLTVRLNSRR